MTDVLLSILIPTVVGREDVCLKLVNKICGDKLHQTHIKVGGTSEVIVYSFMYCELELITWKDNKEITIGDKREMLYKNAQGLFSWQIDDDDEISDNAIQLILEAIKSNPDVDCITFEESIDIDGKIEKSNHSLIYGDWEGEGGRELWDGFHYHRTPFMKSVIKTDIARGVPIPHIRFGEDHQWAQVLKPHLKTEIHLDIEIYKYIYRSTPHNERYGIK